MSIVSTVLWFKPIVSCSRFYMHTSAQQAHSLYNTSKSTRNTFWDGESSTLVSNVAARPNVFPYVDMISIKQMMSCQAATNSRELCNIPVSVPTSSMFTPLVRRALHSHSASELGVQHPGLLSSYFEQHFRCVHVQPYPHPRTTCCPCHLLLF